VVVGDASAEARNRKPPMASGIGMRADEDEENALGEWATLKGCATRP